VTQAETLIGPAADPAERRKGIGGSDIAAVLGLSPYKSPLDLYLEKRGLWQDEAAGEAAYWGTVMEPVLAREFVRRTGRSMLRREPGRGDVEIGPDYEIVQDPSEPWDILGTLTHPKYPWARCHLDGVVLDGVAPCAVWEGKTASEYLSGLWGDPGTDEVPESYLVQVQWGMWLADLEVAHVSPLIGGNRFGQYVVHRDEGLISMMVERAAEFWERVQTGNAPAPEPGERGKESLARLYPRSEPEKQLEATPTLLNLAKGLHQLREAVKHTEEEKVTLENEIKQIMADAERLNLGPKSYIGWKNAKHSEKVDWEAVARALGATDAIVQQHTKVVPGARRFLCQGLDKLST
jgi:predicted phage-related endonuclease